MADDKPTIFLSHASDDKPVLEPLVEALHFWAKLPLWIDRPEEITKNPAMTACGRIPFGEAWDQAIEAGLERGDTVVLYIWSKHALERFKREGEPKVGELRWEMERALERAQMEGGVRLYGVMIDDTPLDDLPEGIRKLQAADISKEMAAFKGTNPPAVFQKLCEKIVADHAARREKARRQTLEAAMEKARAPAPKVAAIDDRIIFRADRSDPFDRITGALNGSSGVSTVLQAGPYDEAPEEFLNRCWEDLGVLAPGVEWRPDWGAPDTFLQRYRQRLIAALWSDGGAPEGGAEQATAAWLADKKQPVAFVSYVSATSWSAKHGKAQIAAWKNFWSDVSKLSDGRTKAVAVLMVAMPEAKEPWWGDCPPGPKQNREVADDFWDAEGRPKPRNETSKLPLGLMLEPMERDALVSYWLPDWVKRKILVDPPLEFTSHPTVKTLKQALIDLTADIKIRTGLLRRQEVKPGRVSMRRFADTVRGIVAAESGQAV